MVLREVKTSRSKESKRRGIAERSNSENWVRENWYIEGSRGIIR